MDDLSPYNFYNFYNEDNNGEQNNIDEPPLNSEIISGFFVLIISLILILMDIFGLYNSYEYLLNSSKKYPFETFDKCIKYQSLTEIYFTLFAFLAAISACLMSIGILLGYDIFFEKFLVTFLNFNYYVFGLLLLSSSLLGIINYNKICYDCIRKDPNIQEFNLSTFLCLILLSIIGGIITFVFSSINAFEYVCNCVKFSKDGNYLLGKAFWKYALGRNNENLHERIE